MGFQIGTVDAAVKRPSVCCDLWGRRIELLVDDGDARDFGGTDFDGRFGFPDAGVIGAKLLLEGVGGALQLGEACVVSICRFRTVWEEPASAEAVPRRWFR